MTTSYLATRERLLTQLDLDEGFWFAIVAGPDDRPRERLRLAVKGWCIDHGVAFHDHALPPSELPELARTLAREPTPGVHWARASGEGASIEGSERGLKQLLLAMNERRDAYTRRLQGPVIIEGRASLRRLLQEFAPDLFSIAVPLAEVAADPDEEPEPSEPLASWHLLPDTAESAETWLDRAHRSNDASERVAALIHAAECSMARRAFSHAAAPLIDALALAEQSRAAGELSEATAGLCERARLWRAMLLIEDGDLRAAESTLEEVRPTEEALSRAAAIERANLAWARGAREVSLAEYCATLQWVAETATVAPQPRVMAEGVVCVVERVARVVMWDRALSTSGSALRRGEVRDEVRADDELATRLWLGISAASTQLVASDRAAHATLSSTLREVASKAAEQADARVWNAVAVCIDADAQVVAGSTTEAARAFEGALAELDSGEVRLGDQVLWGLLATRAVNLSVGEASVRHAEELGQRAITRVSALPETPSNRRWLRLTLRLLALSQAHLLEQQGRIDDALRAIDQSLLLRCESSYEVLGLIGAQSLRGRLLAKQNRRSEAVDTLNSVIALVEQVFRTQGVSGQWKHMLVSAWRELGDAITDENPLHAKRAYQTALTHARRYARSHPNDAQATHELGAALMSRGQCALKQGDLAEAESLIREALSLTRGLVALDPASSLLRRNLATSLIILAHVHDARGDASEANESRQEAQEILSTLTQLDPSDADAARLLSYSRR